MTSASPEMKCEQCGAVILSKDDLERHMTEQHPMPASQQEDLDGPRPDRDNGHEGAARGRPVTSSKSFS